tara:strand:+ start:361 stop:600 length:240 start_codon:yes stop_codon:yes gene_type:complete
MNKSNVVINIDGSKGVIDINIVKSVTMMKHNDGGYHNVTIYLDSIVAGRRETIVYCSRDYVAIENAYDAIINKKSSIKE